MTQSVSRRRLLNGLAVVVGLYGLVALASCNGDSTDTTPDVAELPVHEAHQDGVELPSGLTTQTIGANCIACHEDVVKAYRTSAMHLSLTLPTGAGSVEADLVGRTHVDPNTGITLKFSAEDGHYVQSAVYVDPLGVERTRFDMRVDLVVGSGHATRSYFQIKQGRLLELPLTWYRHLDDVALSPGGGFHGEFLRNGSRSCVGCHTGTLNPVNTDADLGFHGKISLGIGCDRCHGPGEEHAATGDPASIVNPSRLPEARQADLCFQCHLSSGLTVERKGRTIADYRPGEDLSDWLAVLNPVERDEAAGTEIAGHAERMQASRCYTVSHERGDNPMTCTTCHNPHRGHLSDAIAAEVDRGCFVCHTEESCHEEPAAREDRRCHSCHMPEIASRDISHTRITDHRIVSVPKPLPERSLSQHPGEIALRGGPLANSLDPSDTHPLRHLYDARGYLNGAEAAWVLLERRADDWVQRALDAVAAHEAAVGKSAETDAVRGRALTLKGDQAAAVELLRSVRDAEPGLPASHANYAYALAAVGRVPEGVKSLRKAVELDPYDPNSARSLADMLTHQNRLREAIEVLDSSRRHVGPTLLNAVLARDLSWRMNDYPRSLTHAYDVLLFRPLDPAALWRVGRTAERVDDDTERAQAMYERALTSDPNSVPALISLGLLLLKEDRPRARELAERARKIAPDVPQLRELLEQLR